jgi:hypothetical protein
VKLFISWSGPESKIIATGLREFLPRVIQSVDPFMSQHDIEGGELWLQRLLSELNESSTAIACLTPTNLAAPWLNFEAGAIAKAISRKKDQPRVFTYLWKVEPSDIRGPLVHFQATKTERTATEGMVESLRKIAAEALDAQIVIEAVENNWEIMKKAFSAAAKEHAASKSPDAAPRDPAEIQREVLDTVREIAKGQSRLQAQVDLIPTGYISPFTNTTGVLGTLGWSPVGSSSFANVRGSGVIINQPPPGTLPPTTPPPDTSNPNLS